MQIHENVRAWPPGPGMAKEGRLVGRPSLTRRSLGSFCRPAGNKVQAEDRTSACGRSRQTDAVRQLVFENLVQSAFDFATKSPYDFVARRLGHGRGRNRFSQNELHFDEMRDG
jgi:hypothetical protein